MTKLTALTYGVAKPHKPKLNVSDTDSENLRMSFQSDADMCKKEMTVKVLPFAGIPAQCTAYREMPLIAFNLLVPQDHTLVSKMCL